jgi:hypothetical protein
MHSFRNALGSARTIVLFGLALAGCRLENLLVADVGPTPIADARVEGREGKNVQIEYDGEPVSVTLDATHSSDREGMVVAYRWLSGTPSTDIDAGAEEPAAAGGSAEGDLTRRWVPPGEDRSWPEDVAKPTVMLDQGVYSFVLWAIDADRLWSPPDSVRVVVGAEPVEAGAP